MSKSTVGLPVGSRVKFAEEKQAYNVMASDERYAVCTKPFNLYRSVLYTVVDLKLNIRGTENLVFGAGAETVEQCERMLDRLNGRNENSGTTEVSHRNRVPLRVEWIRIAKEVA